MTRFYIIAAQLLAVSCLAQFSFSDVSFVGSLERPPAAPGGSYTTNTLVSDFTPGTATDSSSGNRGMKITVGAQGITVTELGVYLRANAYGTPTVKLYNAACAEIASGSVTSITTSNFNWVAIAPTALTAGQVYSIALVDSYQPWYGSGTTVTATDAAAVTDSTFESCTSETTGVNHSYGPMNLKYYVTP